MMTQRSEQSIVINGPLIDLSNAEVTLSTSLTSVIGVQWLFALVTDIPLKYLWGIINQIQLIEFLLMICIEKTRSLTSVLSALSFANGDF